MVVAIAVFASSTVARPKLVDDGIQKRSAHHGGGYMKDGHPHKPADNEHGNHGNNGGLLDGNQPYNLGNPPPCHRVRAPALSIR